MVMLSPGYTGTEPKKSRIVQMPYRIGQIKANICHYYEDIDKNITYLSMIFCQYLHRSVIYIYILLTLFTYTTYLLILTYSLAYTYSLISESFHLFTLIVLLLYMGFLRR